MKLFAKTFIFVLLLAGAAQAAITIVSVDKYAFAQVLQVVKENKKARAYILLIKVKNNPQVSVTNTNYKDGQVIKAAAVVDNLELKETVAKDKIFYGYVVDEKGTEVWHILGFGDPKDKMENEAK